MNTDPDVRRAQGLLDCARKRLTRRYPFHARFVADWVMTPTATIRSVGITVARGRIEFVYNPTFVNRCLLPELVGVLHHEINHVLFGHVLFDRTTVADPYARMLAEEVTVNEFVPERLPGTPISLALFPDLPPGEDTEQRYRRLARNHGQLYRNPSFVNQNLAASTGIGVADDGNPSVEDKTSHSASSVSHLVPFDDHSVWSSSRSIQALDSMIVRAAIARARADTPEAALDQMPGALRRAIRTVGHGIQPGHRVEQIATDSQPARVRWERALRGFIGRAPAFEPAMNRAPRRFPHLLGVVPGRAYRSARPRVLAVIDTSDSMEPTALSTIAGELRRIGARFEVLVAECDTQIQRTYPFRGGIVHVRGRGGTDLRPPFAATFLARVSPDLIIVFTDGDGPAPLSPPPVPTIWCITVDGVRPAQWGRLVRMG